MEPRPPSSPAPGSSPDTSSPATGSAANPLRAPVPELSRPLSPLEQNRRITEGYARIAQGIQAFLDPAYRPGGEAGKGMGGTAIARRIIDAAQGEASPSVAQAFIRAGVAYREQHDSVQPAFTPATRRADGNSNGPLRWNFPQPLVGPDGQFTGQG